MNLLRVLSLSLLAAVAALLSFSSTCSSQSPKAEKFDFQVISVSEYLFRTVRVFWDPQKTLTMMKIFEKDRLLALESLHYATNMDVTISLNAHSFHVYSLQGLLSRKNASAIIEVPAQSEIISIPAFVVTVTDQGFEYQWVKPDVKTPITNISLILCEMDTNLQTCGNSILGYIEVETEATEFLLKHDESTNMALRIDTSTSSSGIVLPKCKSLQAEVGLLDDRPKLVGNSSHISIEWQLKCPEQGIVYGVIGYNVYYCRLQNGPSCVEPETKLTYKTNDMVLQASINALTPSTRYQIAGTVVLANGTESGRRELVYTTMPAPSTTIRPRFPYRHQYMNRCRPRYERYDRWCRHRPYGQFWN